MPDYAVSYFDKNIQKSEQIIWFITYLWNITVVPHSGDYILFNFISYYIFYAANSMPNNGRKDLLT